MVVIAIHAGCGMVTNRDNMDFKREEETRLVLQEALEAGTKILDQRGSAVEAVVAAVMVLEDCPLFNAGRGSVRTRSNTIEMDAGIMDGYHHLAGACATITNVRNPILLAQNVMERTDHTLICGQGADALAHKFHLDTMPTDYFDTKLRGQQLEHYMQQKEGKVGIGDACMPIAPEFEDGIGTVGAVAMDTRGRFAAAASTGGMTGKMPGAVTHSAIPGGGFYCGEHCAVSASGHCDALLKNTACARIVHLYQDKELTMPDALNEVLTDDLSEVHAGFIAIDEHGDVHMPFNTGLMYRGYMRDKQPLIALFRDEKI